MVAHFHYFLEFRGMCYNVTTEPGHPPDILVLAVPAESVPEQYGPQHSDRFSTDGIAKHSYLYYFQPDVD